jgi:hypothetical protein
MILGGCLGAMSGAPISEEEVLHYLKIWKYSYSCMYQDFTNKNQKKNLSKDLKKLKKKYKKNPRIQEVLKTYY